MSRPDARNALSVVHSVNGSVAPSDKDTDNSHTVAQPEADTPRQYHQLVLLSHQLTSIEVTKMPSLRSPYNGRGACSPSTCRVSGGSWLTPAAAQSASPVADQCMR